MAKTLCKLSKHRREKVELQLLADQGACLMCRKCGRMAPKKKYLCKPQKS